MKDYEITALYLKLANATTTYYCAGGHGKAERNRLHAEDYKAQLIAEGKEIPEDKILLMFGTFNGDGAS